jgi:hypothetical protein
MKMHELAWSIHIERRVWEIKNRTTTAARVQNVVTGEVEVRVAMDVATLPKELVGKLPAGVRFIKGGAHAEETLVNSLGNEWRIIEGAATRNVCLYLGACAWKLGQQGLTIGAPAFKGGKLAIQHRLFWKE